MTGTAATLSTFVQANMPTQTLIELTTWLDNSGSSSIDTTVLTAVCTSAINYLASKAFSYDPATYSWHNDAGQAYVMGLLLRRAEKYEEASSYFRTCKELMEAFALGEKKRRVAPKISTSSSDVVFSGDDNTFWDDFVIDWS